MIHIRPINSTMGTWLVRVRGGSLKWIKANFLPMKPITFPTLFFLPCLMEYGEASHCYDLTPLAFCGITLFGSPCCCWDDGVDEFFGLFLLNPIITTKKFTIFNSMCYDNRNTFTNVCYASWSNIMHFLFMFLVQNPIQKLDNLCFNYVPLCHND